MSQKHFLVACSTSGNCNSCARKTAAGWWCLHSANKRFVVAGRENNGGLGRNPTYVVSLCFVLTHGFHVSDFLFHHKHQKTVMCVLLWTCLDFDISIRCQTPPAAPFWGELGPFQGLLLSGTLLHTHLRC